MTHFLLDTAAQPFADAAWNARDVLSCAPCIDLKPGASIDQFAGECKLWWENAPDQTRAVHIMRTGAALMPGHWLGPLTPAQYREQLLGGFNRLGYDVVWFDELAFRFDYLGLWPEIVYQSFEDQAQPFEVPNDHPWWAFIDGLTGDRRLPRNLRYTTRYGFTKITSLAAWLQQRTPYVKSCWYAWFNPIQWGMMRAAWAASRLAPVPVCSWNQPNYSYSDPAMWPNLWNEQIGSVPCLPMYNSTPEWLAKYDAILGTFGGNMLCYVRPDMPFAEQLKIIDKHDVDLALVFCDPTRTEQWKAGIGPFIDQVRDMREE